MNDHMSREDWKASIEEAKKRSSSLKTHSALGVTDMIETPNPGLHKRWFGKFIGWLKKLSHVETGNDGFLTMGHHESFLLYKAKKR